MGIPQIISIVWLAFINGANLMNDDESTNGKLLRIGVTLVTVLVLWWGGWWS